jgi:hypothetical protein
MSAHDNIADAPAEALDQDTEEYMKRFDAIATKNQALRRKVASFGTMLDDRLTVAIECIKAQQKLNDDIYDLLVDMNNFFAPK